MRVLLLSLTKNNLTITTLKAGSEISIYNCHFLLFYFLLFF